MWKTYRKPMEELSLLRRKSTELKELEAYIKDDFIPLFRLFFFYFSKGDFGSILPVKIKT
jgi:hypothetical protein